jgi:anti-sigma B factor antagonist
VLPPRQREIHVEEPSPVSAHVCGTASRGSRFEVAVNERGTTTSVELAGECDLAARGPVRDAVSATLARDPECVVLDLTGTTFIDACGVGVVVEIARRARARGVRLVICPGPPAVDRVFALCQLTDVLPFVRVASRSAKPREHPWTAEGSGGVLASGRA